MPPTDAQVLAAARMLCKIHAGQCQVDEDDTWKVYGEQFKDDARDALIAALSAQRVAGAVAEPDCWAILTPNGSKLVSPDEAKGRKDAYPLYAAPQPQAAPAPEPSAQGEPVAFDRMEVRAIVQQAYLALEELQGPGFLIGGVMHYRIGLILPKLNEAINALASAPSTQPPAVEAVPLDEHVHAVVRSVQPYLDVRCRAWQELTEQCRYWLKAERAHGIAPKAAQPVAGAVAQWPVCGNCGRKIHPLEDMHHLWCQGPSAQAAPAPEPSAQALDIAFELGRVEAMQETSAFNASALRKALSAMLTHFGMDEDEWNKPTLDQARAALAEYDSFTLHPAPEPSAQAVADDPDSWEANAKYLLDRCPHTVWQRPGGGPLDLKSTLVVTFMGMQQKIASSPKPEPSAQAGWKLVPVEPTQAMLDALQGPNPRIIPAYVGAREKMHARELAAYAAMLAASPQPEQSAQGEPVRQADERGDMAMREWHRECDDADTILRALGLDPVNCRTDGGSLKTGMILDALQARDRMLQRSAPSTPPHAVVEAVPLEIDYDALITAAFKRYHYAQGTGPCVAFKRGAEWMRDQVNHGIAPKAAQEKP